MSSRAYMINILIRIYRLLITHISQIFCYNWIVKHTLMTKHTLTTMSVYLCTSLKTKYSFLRFAVLTLMILCVVAVEMDHDGSEYSILFGIRQVPCDE